MVKTQCVLYCEQKKPMPISRAEQLSFCERCKNRKMNLQQGLLCGLTNQKADFDPICPSFDEDPAVKIHTPASEDPIADWLKPSQEEAIEADKHEKYLVHQRFDLALLGGFLAAILGACLWTVVSILTEYQIGYMAVGLGVLVGYAVQFFGAGIELRFRILAGVLALLSCVVGNLLTQFGFYAYQESYSLFGAMSQFALTDYPTILLENLSPIDFLFYALAASAGFKFALRKPTLGETAQVNNHFFDPAPPHASYRIPVLLATVLILGGFVLMGNRTYSGPRMYYHENGKLSSTGEMANGKMQGDWTFYDEEGRKSQSGTLYNGIANGTWNWYTPEGQLYQSQDYVFGNEEGLFKAFYPNNSLSDSIRFVKGRRNGLMKSYFADGKLKSEGRMENDLRQGKWVTYYESGKVQYKIVYKDDLIHGDYFYYHPNGQLGEHFVFESGRCTNLLEQYAADGSPLVKNGNGNYRSMTDEAVYNGSGPIKNGKAFGQWELFANSTKISLKATFVDTSFIINEVMYGAKAIVKNGNGQYRDYAIDGKTILIKGEIREGRRHGKWTTYFEDGTLSEEINYDNGTLTGRYLSKYVDGTNMYECTYKKGKVEGMCQWYHPNGQLSAEVEYKQGAKQGWQSFFAEDGQLIRKERWEDNRLLEVVVENL